MRTSSFLFCFALLAQPASGSAQQHPAVAAPALPQLHGIGQQEAGDLLRKLKDAQRGLEAGKFQPFELLAGSIASYQKANVSPRQAFLAIRFSKIWRIERAGTGNRLWQSFKLAYAPDGLGKPYWDIEVAVGMNGNLERVAMLFRPPAPY